jgi:CubicO group peptidase (beta-lactamase class C family)
MNKRHLLVLMVTLYAFALMACSTTAAPSSLPAYWPTDGWQSEVPEDHGFDAALSETIATRAQELPFLDSLLIIRHGYLVHESYYNGYDATTLHDIASVTKSWTSALVGIAQAEEKLTGLDAPLSELLPDYFGAGDYADKQSITLRHLLQMRSGLAFSEDELNSGTYGGVELLETDLTQLALTFSVNHPPGESWNYSTLDSQLISAIVQQAVDQPLASYAESTLFASLGIDEFEWWEDGVGTTIGGQNLSMTPRNMAKLGLLYLHDGVWEGKRLLPEGWVTLSLTPQDDPAYYPPTDKVETIEWYGYHWWIWKGDWFFGFRSFQASGYAGQQVTVFPELELIVATTSNLAGVDIDTEIAQRTALNEILFLEVIFPALTNVDLTQ